MRSVVTTDRIGFQVDRVDDYTEKLKQEPKTDAMVSHYVAEANPKKLAKQAMKKFENAQPNLDKVHNLLKRRNDK